MKRSLVVALAAMLMSMGTVFARAQAIQFPAESVTSRLERIQNAGKPSGQMVSYNESVIKEKRLPALAAKTNNMEEWLYESLKDTELTYRKVRDSYYSVYRKADAPSEPLTPEPAKKNGTLTGKVVDENGEEMPGATVKIMGHQQGTATGLNGDFSLSLPPGTYTVEVGFIGYDTQHITDVRVEEGKATPLSVALNTSSTKLGEVVVTANYNKSSTAGALRVQQNMPQVSAVMAAEQIGKTSDKNLGEALKRITGVSTMDNKYVAVRGMGERWNEASLDGVTLPSTEANNKAFSFDLIPTNIIDNVTVVKTATPDMNANFAGGFIQVQTKDMPDKNFISLQAGYSYNTESTGKEQQARQRGAKDWLGFDDGRRAWPTGLKPTSFNEMEELSKEQTRKFTRDNFSLYTSKTPLSQNYQFSLGRLFNTGNMGDRLGFILSLSYRNTQQQKPVEAFERGNWKQGVSKTDEKGNILPDQINATGADYQYGTVLAGILNGGYQFGNHRLSFRNTYTRKFDNNLFYLEGFDDNYYYSEDLTPARHHDNFPTFQDLLQSKLEGQHLLGKVKLNWDLARTFVKRNQLDAASTYQLSESIDGEQFWSDVLKQPSDRSFITRRHYENKETDWNWGLSAEAPFNLGEHIRNTAKAGYMGVSKKNHTLFEDARMVRLDTKAGDIHAYNKLPVAEKLDPETMINNGYAWWIPFWSGGVPAYEGKVSQHAPYLMFDHRYRSLVRLVWGARAEYYNYKEISNPYESETSATLLNDSTQIDKKWQWMPSASLTITPFENFNIRLGYSRSVIRPQFMERTFFQIYDPLLSGYTYSWGVTSTTVDGADFRLEWYPGAGEVISAGVFYRYLDKPIERIRNVVSSTGIFYILQNSNWAKNTGVELELRKNLGFIADSEILRNLYLYGNASFIRSEVEALKREYEKDKETGKYKMIKTPVQYTRPLYGQVPYMFNMGVNYEGKQLGLNLTINRTGRKVNMLGGEFAAYQTEYEAAQTLMDAQISYTLPKQGLTFKLNGSNLLNSRTVYYWNHPDDFEKIKSNTGQELIGNKLLSGKSEEYEPGHDEVTYQYRTGRSFSFSATWTF